MCVRVHRGSLDTFSPARARSRPTLRTRSPVAVGYRLLKCLAAAALLGLLLGTSPAFTAQEASPAPAGESDVLTVGVKVAPPFVIKEGNRYTGLAMEVWEAAAAEHHWRYRLQQFDLAGLLAATSDGRIAAGLGAVTATAERERHMDFSHTLVSSGLAIAVARNPTPGWRAMLQSLTTPGFLASAGGLFVVLLIVATLMWAVERRGNPAQFSRRPARGIGAGLWWAGVTAATVGYGDKIPRSLAGRFVALSWMFIALVAVSAFTATITSALTVEHLEGRVRSPSDLPYARVATVAGTTSAEWLAEHHIAFTAAASPGQALAELRAGHVDAVVYDAPLLSYLLHRDRRHLLRLLPQTFDRQDYVITLPQGSPLRKPLNETLLTLLQDPQWTARWAALRHGTR